jgi:hypothetical protein
MRVLSDFGGHVTWTGLRWSREKPYYDDNHLRAEDCIALAEMKYEQQHEWWTKKGRIAYLWQEMRRLAQVYSDTEGPIMGIVWLDQMKGILREIRRVKRLRPPTKGDITHAMKLKAREYPIENVLAEYGIVIGRHNKCLCPFHDDTRPSMSIYNNRFNCFSCGQKGDVIALYRRLSGASFPAAVRRLAP